jgi:hypothetical protein
MLHPAATPHPLSGHPKAAGLILPSLPGTLSALTRISPNYQHHSIYINSQEDPTELQKVAYPYIGDLVLFLEDKDGPYCVNWNVKSDPEGYSVRPDSTVFKEKRKSRALSPQVRHDLEHLYFKDGGIRTIDATPQALHPRLIGNLLWILPKIGDGIAKKDLSGFYSDLPGACTLSPQLIATRAAEWSGHSISECKTELWKCIWNRILKIDLFQSIFDDVPLQPQVIDPIDLYAHLFSREE